MKQLSRTCSRYLALAVLPLFVLGCDNKADAPSNTSSTKSEYLYRVNPALDTELKKRVPELLVIDENAECLHYSTGYANGFFLASLDKLFTQFSNPVGKPHITDEMRQDFIARHPEQIAQLNVSVQNLAEDVREAAFNKVVDDTITQNLHAAESRQGYAYCDQHLDEHLSWIVDSDGKPVTREQILLPNVVTVLQYRNEDCDDCIAQQRDIDQYISTRHLFVNYVFVERSLPK